jgi:hypothetical protein
MATYYINADTGNDTTGDGSQFNPWLTLSKANSSSASGDTIFCQNSTNTYLFQTLTIVGKNIIGQSTNGVIFDGGSQNVGWSFNTTSSQVKNITVQNIIRTGSYNRIFNFNVDSTFTGCVFREFSCENIFSGGANITIELSLFYDFQGTLFFVGANNQNFNFYNNTVIYERTNTLVTNFVSPQSNVNAYFINNIFANYQANTIDFTRASVIINGTNNCLYGPFIDYPTHSSNLINTDPLFIDYSVRNYNLSPSSPCIDTGTLI